MRLTAIHSLIAIALLGTAGPALAQQHVEGETGPGALYALDMPIAWNGDLVVYAHGIVDPVLPKWLPDMTVRNLRVGKAVVDLRFWREGERTRYDVLSVDGELRVTSAGT